MFKNLMLVMLLAGCSATVSTMEKATVMITNKEGSSGGTGVIYSSGNEGSKILTNAHVCGVVKNGGLVHSYKGAVAVEKYTLSKQHDLCMLEVITNLEVNTTISNSLPKLGDITYVAGHPFLFPTTVTKGTNTGPMTIQIMTEIRPCTKEDLKNNGMLCYFLGGIPMIKEYNTTTISNIIAPGNSGSAVYNESGNLVGLVFAGYGRNLSPGFIVPFEYIRSFLYLELTSPELVKVNSAEAKPLNIQLNSNKQIFYPAIKLPICSKPKEFGCTSLLQ